MHVFISLGFILRNRIAGLYSSSIFNFLKNCLIVFQSCCTSFHSHQQWMKFLFLIVLVLFIVRYVLFSKHCVHFGGSFPRKKSHSSCEKNLIWSQFGQERILTNEINQWTSGVTGNFSKESLRRGLWNAQRHVWMAKDKHSWLETI